MPAWGEFLDKGCVEVGSTDHDSTDAAGYYAAAVRSVHHCIDALERDGVPPERVVVAGFSQGAALALLGALTYTRPLAGCVVLSGWMLPSAKRSLANSANRESQFLLVHGTEDTDVNCDCGDWAARQLRAAGAHVEFEEFEGLDHDSCEYVEDAVARFLGQTLASFPDAGGEPDAEEDDDEDDDGDDDVLPVEPPHSRGVYRL